MPFGRYISFRETFGVSFGDLFRALWLAQGDNAPKQDPSSDDIPTLKALAEALEDLDADQPSLLVESDCDEEVRDVQREIMEGDFLIRTRDADTPPEEAGFEGSDPDDGVEE